jgi:hypothetical protein
MHGQPGLFHAEIGHRITSQWYSTVTFWFFEIGGLAEPLAERS